MFLRSHQRTKDGKDHIYWSLVETARMADGPRQKTLCYLGELNSSAQARWVKTIEVFNDEARSSPWRCHCVHDPGRAGAGAATGSAVTCGASTARRAAGRRTLAGQARTCDTFLVDAQVVDEQE